MNRHVIAATLACAAGITAFAQQPNKPQLPKSQLPDLGRPTQGTDEQPPFNFGEYFVGKWTFEWDAPEGSLGPSGMIKGSVVYTSLDPASDTFYEATTSATGASGPFTIKEVVAYRKDGKTASRWMTDSRGFSYMQVAPVGGDLGGYFNLYFDSSPFMYNGKRLRIKNAIRITSPLRFRNTVSLSTDGGPFLNYGAVWFEKER
jgi:hypothetical protein